MDARRLGISAVATLALARTAIAADSTSVEEVDVPWQPPSYAATSGSAGYASNAGQLGGKAENQLNVAKAGQASYVPSDGVTGIPTCVVGYVLQKTATGFLCVNTIANANAANSASYSTTAGNGVESVSDGNLNLTNGTQHDLKTGGGGGGTLKSGEVLTTRWCSFNPYSSPHISYGQGYSMLNKTAAGCTETSYRTQTVGTADNDTGCDDVYPMQWQTAEWGGTINLATGGSWTSYAAAYGTSCPSGF